MVIGVPKEIKSNEGRVAITPAGVYEMIQTGHTVLIENNAGIGSSITDLEYTKAGAIMTNKKYLFDKSDIIFKVKEPLEEEYQYFKDNQILFTYLHLAADKKLADFLLSKNITAIAYETLEDKNGLLPLLNPMSEVAGRMAVQVGANLLQKNNNGRGILLGGVTGVKPANVAIIGAGNVGKNALKIALGMGANVTILDVAKDKLDYIDDIYFGRVKTLISNSYNISETVKDADLLIGAVLIPGKKAPKIVTEEMVKTMKEGSVIVDVAIDQGGCIETIDRITTHDNPYYQKFGVVHYSVANMPGAVANTSTYALTSATLPYLKRITTDNIENILKENLDIQTGLNIYKGKCTNENVAKSLGYEYYSFSDI